jgi:hypothetical protein
MNLVRCKDRSEIPETTEETKMATIGPKEQQRKALREGKAIPTGNDLTRAAAAALSKDILNAAGAGKTKPRAAVPAKPEAQAEPAPKKESDARKPKKKNAAARKPAKGKTAPVGKIDRSPLAVGNFIAGGGNAGVAMADLVKEFGIEAHPMRTKIFQARHDLKFKIEFDTETKRYVGSAPKAKAA